MAPAPSSPLEIDFAAALDWWREAGVDAAFADEPTAWLAEPESATEVPPPSRAATELVPASAPERQIGGPRENWPQDLAAFSRWWIADPSLDEGGLAPRVPPRGEPGAALMVLVAMPEASDVDELLSGSAGALLDGFIAAAGIPSDRVYRASALPRHTPMPDWAELEREGLGRLLSHHVLLAQPESLLILGQSILPLCGHDPAQRPAALSFFNHEGGRVPALAEVGLDRLLAKGQSRARLWKRWLDWTDGTTWQEGGDATDG